MTDKTLTQEEKIQRGAEDAGRYFRTMTQFVGFTPQDAEAIRESALVIEKHLPAIVTSFYANLLKYPPTRKFFLKRDGTIDQDYVQKRMHHLTNFWRRSASGMYDDDYARYIDYVGRAHTSHGADPNIYIAERYVIGQVGFMQHAINEALVKELHEYDPDLEQRAVQAWNKLMMVILEMLARAYSDEHEMDNLGDSFLVNQDAIQNLAVKTYELGLGMMRNRQLKEVLVGKQDEIPDGERKIIQVDELSIGVFHHKGGWYALRNHCLHVGGPIATGSLEGDTLICPWHGFEYDIKTGELLFDNTMKLEMYPVTVRDEKVYLEVTQAAPEPEEAQAELIGERVESVPNLGVNEFLVSRVGPGQTYLVRAGEAFVAIFNVEGQFYATQAVCTHAGGPLNEGFLNGAIIQCPIHGARFNVTTGEVVRGPAKNPLRRYQVIVDGDVGRVELL